MTEREISSKKKKSKKRSLESANDASVSKKEVSKSNKTKQSCGAESGNENNVVKKKLKKDKAKYTGNTINSDTSAGHKDSKTKSGKKKRIMSTENADKSDANLNSNSKMNANVETSEKIKKKRTLEDNENTSLPKKIKRKKSSKDMGRQICNTDDGMKVTKTESSIGQTSADNVHSDSGKKGNKRNKSKSNRKRGHGDKREIREDKKAKKVLASLLTEDDDKKTDEMDKEEGEVRSIESDNKKGKKKGKDKIKKPKDAQKEEDVSPTDAMKTLKKEEALNHLILWKKNRKNWKFQKARQIWLMKHMYDPVAIDDKNFSYLVEYLQGATGGAKTRLLTDAQTIFDSSLKDDGESESETKLKRARNILQAIAE